MSEFADGLQSSLVRTTEESVLLPSKQWVEDVEALSGKVGELGSSQNQSLWQAQTMVGKYTSEELIQDVATGRWQSAKLMIYYGLTHVRPS